MSLLRLVRSADLEEPERAAILDAALDAFLDFGIKRTSMGEIAKRARISPATLYRRFPQKAAVVQAVVLREARVLIDGMDRRVDPQAGVEDQVIELAIAFLDGVRNHRLLTRVVAADEDVALPFLTVRGAPVLELGTDYLVEFIERLQREGKLPRYDPEPVAEMLTRVAHSLALTPQTRMPLDDEWQARQFVREHVAVLFLLFGATGNQKTETA